MHISKQLILFSMNSQQNIFDTIPASQLNTYQQLFSFFDKQDSGQIPISSVPMFIRGLGHCPTQAQIAKILQDFGWPKVKKVNFHTLIQFIIKRPREQQIEQQLVDAFYAIQVYLTSSAEAGKNQLMQINPLRKLLTEAGEPLNQLQIQAFTQFLNTNDLKVYEQQFNYRNLSKILAYTNMQN